MTTSPVPYPVASCGADEADRHEADRHEAHHDEAALVARHHKGLTAMNIPESAAAVITSGRLAHFTTIQPDGRPHTTIVWVDLQDNEIIIGKMMEDRKVANIRRDPRVSLSMEGDGQQHGLANYLVVDGTARVIEGGAPELLQHLAHRYIGPDAKFPPMPNPPPGFVIRITPTKIRGMGPWGTTF
jgi:PPOX class probable F420-dependent enzyme